MSSIEFLSEIIKFTEPLIEYLYFYPETIY
jgi:hypothetical protein